MMLLNNSVALLPMTVLLAAFGEPQKWYLVRGMTPHQWALLVASCVNAGAISWAGINAQGYVTATTFMVLTNVNKFVGARAAPPPPSDRPAVCRGGVVVRSRGVVVTGPHRGAGALHAPTASPPRGRARTWS